MKKDWLLLVDNLTNLLQTATSYFLSRIRMLKANGLQDGTKLYTPTISIMKPTNCKWLTKFSKKLF